MVQLHLGRQMRAVALTLALDWAQLERSGRKSGISNPGLARRGLGRDGETALLGLILAMVMRTESLDKDTGKDRDN